MKALFAILLASVLSLAAFAQSQDQGAQGSQTTPGTQSQTDTKASTGMSMSGTISKDGKSFKSDTDSKKYKVDNPDTLKGKEGQHVTLTASVDANTNTVHVIDLQAPQQ